MSVEIKFTEEAQDYLIDRAIELNLNSEQKIELKKLFDELKYDPYNGKIYPLSIGPKYYIEQHIGKKIHAAIHYDICATSIIIGLISLHYKF